MISRGETINNPTGKILLKAEEAANALSVSLKHFYNIQRSGRLGPGEIRLGKSVRWSRDELEEWANEGCPPREKWQQIKAMQKNK